jgi:nicotinate-nucleotide pyrophosphorylase (carboxylating)
MVDRPLFTPADSEACRRLIGWALDEDLNTVGDLTSQAIIPPDLPGRAVFRTRAEGIVAGLPAAEMVFATLNSAVRFDSLVQDGTRAKRGDCLARVVGPMRDILAGERTALNFLQRLSGVATRTWRYVEAVAGLPCRILDTRKTIPGWRLLEKYAVRCGGGSNHRMGLFDAVLIKDNHLAALGNQPDAILRAIRAAREFLEADDRLAAQTPQSPVEVTVEVDTLDQLDAALACRPDIVLLDNMNPATLREAVRRRNAAAPGVLLEASGGVNLTTVRAIAETGVDRISVGELTHSAPALDIGLDYGDW